VTGLLLASSASAFADISQYNKHVARQNLSPTLCVPPNLQAGNGDHKIGFVIDSSGSMASSDPTNVRLEVAKAIDDLLISKSEATGGKKEDLVTVVEFSDDATLLYPLGDPSGAGSTIDGIIPGGDTAIGSGIKAAIDELTKPGNDPTANRTGIIVLTDGQDTVTGAFNETISEINRAAGLGIRVSFGFLSIDSSNQDRQILNAILHTGGSYALVDQAGTQQSFIPFMLSHGLTGIDANGANGPVTLLPGISSAAFVSQSGSNTFDYSAKAGETFNVTVTAIDPNSLTVTLRDAKAKKDLATNTTDTSTQDAFLQYTATSDTDVEVIVSAANSSSDSLFSIGLKSSLSTNSNNNCTVPSTSPNSTTVQPPSTPSASQPVQYTGGATSVIERSHALFSIVLPIFGFVAAAMLL
jgi:hypothetical protein